MSELLSFNEVSRRVVVLETSKTGLLIDPWLVLVLNTAVD